MSKTLVTYFTASGVTRKAAEKLAQTIGADLYEIKPAVLYTQADLDYMNQNSRSSVEMKDPASRPELADKDANIAAYDVIYVGYPIWWGVAPHVVNSFLEAYDFRGKTVVPFATSGGSGVGNVQTYIAPSVPGAVVKEGKRLGGTEDAEALKVWALS
ncbi:MAG: flavodoxin [Lachnospiraceae bacterium]|nr:flavodoxin [Lachnospiraceae bacterium]